jgi:4-alpha-glucanotransferase
MHSTPREASANRQKSLPRAAGVQLHLTSLPSGRLGAEAYRFVDWLAAAGQSYWQILPLNPPDRHGSPYRSSSAFACWPALLERPRAPVSASDEEQFRAREAYWIGDWERYAGGRRAVREQVRFDREWSALRAYAASAGVALVGDIPLYVAPRGVDHRSHSRLFNDSLLAGAPPDGFNASGQLWGNPVYDWPALARTGYRWWVERLRRASALYDLVRLDHFRGFVAYWAVPAGARSARHGSWRRGPGAAPLLHARRELGGLPLIAEDLGAITPAVERLRERLAIPGMAVLQFVYDAAAGDPLEDAARGRVLYTATHDQTTLSGWWDALGEPVRGRVLDALRARGIRRGAGPWPLLALAHRSSASLVIAQMQDVLGLPAQARMNTPGTATGNWRWRLEPGAGSAALARRLREITEAAGRLG